MAEGAQSICIRIKSRILAVLFECALTSLHSGYRLILETGYYHQIRENDDKDRFKAIKMWGSVSLLFLTFITIYCFML